MTTPTQATPPPNALSQRRKAAWEGLCWAGFFCACGLFLFGFDDLPGDHANYFSFLVFLFHAALALNGLAIFVGLIAAASPSVVIFASLFLWLTADRTKSLNKATTQPGTEAARRTAGAVITLAAILGIGVWSGLGLAREEKYFRDEQTSRNRRDDADAHRTKGRALDKTGHLDAAIAEYEQARVLEPEYLYYRLRLARLYRKRGRTAQAIAEYRSVIEQEGKKAIPLGRRGRTIIWAKRSKRRAQPPRRGRSGGRRSCAFRLRWRGKKATITF